MIKHLKLQAAAFALVFAGIMSAGAAYGESITFLIQSEHPNIVSVEFYSRGCPR